MEDGRGIFGRGRDRVCGYDLSASVEAERYRQFDRQNNVY
jgi:hypothetical protein